MSTAKAKYGNEHRRLRRALMAEMDGKPCTRCGRPLRHGDEVDLDHTEDGRSYLGLAHAKCNRIAGAVKGNAARRRPVRSRDW